MQQNPSMPNDYRPQVVDIIVLIQCRLRQMELIREAKLIKLIIMKKYISICLNVLHIFQGKALDYLKVLEPFSLDI